MSMTVMHTMIRLHRLMMMLPWLLHSIIHPLVLPHPLKLHMIYGATLLRLHRLTQGRQIQRLPRLRIRTIAIIVLLPTLGHH